MVVHRIGAHICALEMMAYVKVDALCDIHRQRTPGSGISAGQSVSARVKEREHDEDPSGPTMQKRSKYITRKAAGHRCEEERKLQDRRRNAVVCVPTRPSASPSCQVRLQWKIKSPTSAGFPCIVSPRIGVSLVNRTRGFEALFSANIVQSSLWPAISNSSARVTYRLLIPFLLS